MATPPENRKFAVVLSANSRHGRKFAAVVDNILAPSAEYIVLAGKPWAQKEAIAKALEAGIEDIWIGGGDGSIRAAAQQLVGTDAVMSILPFGTGNALAHELGIPMAPRAAIDFHLHKSVVRSIDVGAFSGDVFVTVATLGLTTRIMEQVAKSNKGVFGRLVYVPAVVKAMHFSQAFQLKVETDQGCFEGSAMQFVAASTRYHGGLFAVTENASIDDGKLSVYVLEDSGRSSLTRYGWALLFGRQTKLPEVWSTEATHVKVTLQSEKKFVVDGDPTRKSAVEIEIRPLALRVSAAPATA